MKLKEGATYTRADYGVVVLDEHTGKYFRLNETASWVFVHLVASDPPLDLESEYSSRYGVENDVARRDIGLVSERLVSLGVLIP
ncbi:PqqD family peptide modification chaperone [Nocardiopsis salina]|uniref:PqqD family peptide modification chaperone n=1 Tax=Nocardiopsis salina TaxID=245836 RepID=UPI00034D4B38|nr:PqqD family peptide modification chaperone [Nocardiopsis salina]